MRLIASGLALAAALAVVGAPRETAAQTQIRFASVGGLPDAGLYLAEELGFFKEAGLTVSMRRMANAPALVAAVATDQIDVGGISLTPGLFTSIQQGIGLRIVGDKQSFRPGFAATRLVVRKELLKGSKADAIKSLRGRPVGIAARASTNIVNLAKMFGPHKMTINDVKLVQMAYPSMTAALSSGALDAAYLIEPFLSEAIRRGLAIDVANIGEMIAPGEPSYLAVPLVYSEKFAQQRKTAQGFMNAYVKGVRVYNDAFVKGIDKEKVMEIMARHAGVNIDVVRSSYPAGLDPDQIINVQTIEDMQKFFIEQRLISTPADISKLVDNSFAQAAVATLGKY